jgi:hypothetical protein
LWFVIWSGVWLKTYHTEYLLYIQRISLPLDFYK